MCAASLLAATIPVGAAAPAATYGEQSGCVNSPWPDRRTAKEILDIARTQRQLAFGAVLTADICDLARSARAIGAGELLSPRAYRPRPPYGRRAGRRVGEQGEAGRRAVHHGGGDRPVQGDQRMQAAIAAVHDGQRRPGTRRQPAARSRRRFRWTVELCRMFMPTRR